MADLPRDFRSQAYLVVDEMVDHFHEEFEGVCESPIEVAFASAFMVLGHIKWGRVGLIMPGQSDDMAALFPAHYGSVLALQRPIGQYRADFVAQPFPLREGMSVVVECDGHDFHERTKEQAQHDRARDRAVQAAGLKVFRFTGSEIYRDAFKCADEVHAELMRLHYARPTTT